MAKRTRGACIECSKPFESNDRRNYIYPIPTDEPHKTADNRVGGFACDDCKPLIIERQMEMGLVVDARINEEAEANK